VKAVRDDLVGRFFHSFKDGDADLKFGSLIDGRQVEWQGRIVGRNDHGYVVELFSWWDGTTNGQRFVAFDQSAEWVFYETAIAMQAALGCSETFEDRHCRADVSILITSNWSAPLLACAKCARFYLGHRRKLTDADFYAPKPTLAQTRTDAVHDLVSDLENAGAA
jgi:hypothetical protein